MKRSHLSVAKEASEALGIGPQSPGALKVRNPPADQPGFLARLVSQGSEDSGVKGAKIARVRRKMMLWGVALMAFAAWGCSHGVPRSTSMVILKSQAKTSESKELTVLAAASLKESFTKIASDFEQTEPSVKVSSSFAGSQQLALQIGKGAPADVFASADLDQMKVAEKSGRIKEDKVQDLVGNRLVAVASPKSSVANLQDLSKPGVKVVLAAGQVPVGKYTLTMLAKVSPSFRQEVLRNVVSYEQDVRAVLTKVELGEADAGVVYATDAFHAGAKVKQIEIPEDQNEVARYYFAPLEGSNSTLASKFVSFVETKPEQQVLTGAGFTLPQGTSGKKR